MKYTNRWEMPEVTFYEIEDHGFPQHEGRPLYAYGKPKTDPDAADLRGIPKTGELHASLDRALIAWVSEKYTGPRGAGGAGVGTAADWFARMIGMDDLVEVEHRAGQKALAEVLADAVGSFTYQRAQAVANGLEARGLVLAAHNEGGGQMVSDV